MLSSYVFEYSVAQYTIESNYVKGCWIFIEIKDSTSLQLINHALHRIFQDNPS